MRVIAWGKIEDQFKERSWEKGEWDAALLGWQDGTIGGVTAEKKAHTIREVPMRDGQTPLSASLCFDFGHKEGKEHLEAFRTKRPS